MSQRRRSLADVVSEVLTFVAENPGISSNDVVRGVARGRNVTLASLRLGRAARVLRAERRPGNALAWYVTGEPLRWYPFDESGVGEQIKDDTATIRVSSGR